MIPKEAIDNIMWTPLMRSPNEHGELKEALYMAISALEKADKYRWHDLRKDPNDLPEVGVDVLVFGIEGAFPCYQVCTYGTGISDCFEYFADHTSFNFEEPIGWKYIEPMEGAEEE